jgi:hypothetical protein
VTDEEFTSGDYKAAGQYEAVCGHAVLVGSALLSPRPPCARCHAYLIARATLRSPQARLGSHRHRKPSRWRRLFADTPTPAVPLPRTPPDATPSPERDGRTTTPAGTSSAPTTFVPAGHHKRGIR